MIINNKIEEEESKGGNRERCLILVAVGKRYELIFNTNKQNKQENARKP